MKLTALAIILVLLTGCSQNTVRRNTAALQAFGQGISRTPPADKRLDDMEWEIRTIKAEAEDARNKAWADDFRDKNWSKRK